MGTRHLTSIFDANDVEILTIYGQGDGYPTGHGQDLLDKFGKLRLVNGLSGDDNVANGMQCLAAQIVAGLKDGPGGIYIYAPGSRNVGEEYHYVIKPEIKGFQMDGNGRIMLEVYSGPMTAFGSASEEGATKPIYSGPLSEFDPEKAEEDDE